MPIAVVNHLYFQGGETETGSEPDVGTAQAAAFNATVNISQSSAPATVSPAAAMGSAIAFTAFVQRSTSSDLSHGEQLAPISIQVGAQIGPTGTLTTASAGTFSGTQTISNKTITGTVVIAAGANITFSNCRLIGSGADSYVVSVTRGGGSRCTLEDCEVIQTSGDSKAITMFGDGNLRLVRTIVRGGEDNVFIDCANSAGVWSTGDSLVPNARVWAVECWFGDCMRHSGSHTDCFQIDGGGYTLIDKCRIMAYNIPVGSSPLTTRVENPATAERGGGGLILTQKESDPHRISNVAIRRSWWEGGNVSCDMGPTDGLPVTATAATNNKAGLRHQFSTIRGGITRGGNVWGQTGVTEPGVSVVAGQPIPGG